MQKYTGFLGTVFQNPIIYYVGSVATYSYFSYFTCVQVIDFLMVMIILVSHMEMQLWVLANFYDYFN